MDSSIDTSEKIKTLETEVKGFANELPYWAKYLCSEILAGTIVSDTEIDISFSYLLQDLNLIEKTERAEISLIYNSNASRDFKESLTFNELKKVEGVNALAENQSIEFSPHLTLIYGINGAGKSGYIRLLKNIFYSKDKEAILENVNIESGHKSIYAELDFSSGDENIPLKYPENSGSGIFNQFAVFDREIGKRHLSNRNDFSFRPAGLVLFNEFNSALEKLQGKISSEIQTRPIYNAFAGDDIFQGESEIKTFLSSFNHTSKIEELKKHLPFTEEDKTNKIEIEKAFDDLKIALSQKEKSLKTLQEIKVQLADRRTNLVAVNSYFNQEYLNSVQASISICKEKQEIAKKEGAEKFKTEKLKNVGTPEWKQFIEAAERFALSQKATTQLYPETGDNCLLCQQPITDDEPNRLIKSYWEYIKSIAEQEAKTAQTNLDQIKEGFEKLNLDQLPATDVLTVWLKENHTKSLETLIQTLANQKTLAKSIISDINTKGTNQKTAIQLDLNLIDTINAAIDSQIKAFEEDEQNKALTELLKKKTYLIHKEKLQIRIAEIEKLHQNMLWVNKASQFNKQGYKTQSTNTEKRLSREYFNPEYISSFNDECTKLNGNFGIEIDAKSSDGQSNRKLYLKGKNPSSILSEGEQNVIALADFIAETKHSKVNMGIVFDDPVTSMDQERKSIIAERLVTIAKDKQVIIFTHDLVFVSSLINCSLELKIPHDCHWVESSDSDKGLVHLKNSPSYDKKYRNDTPVAEHYKLAKDASPEERERHVRSGFAALRTCYETFVIYDIFKNIVQRFNDRVSVMSLSSVCFDDEIIKETMLNFEKCCKYMEGHTHSDNSAANKPDDKTLFNEIEAYNALKKKYKETRKQNGFNN